MKFFKIFLFLVLLLPFSANAVGVSVSPAELDFLFPDIKQSNIDIKNISQEPIVVYVYSDEFQNSIVIDHQEFQLLPDQITRVKISTNFIGHDAGIRKTNISVLSKALDKKSFNAFSGIKIPVTVYITKSYFQWSGQAIFVVVFFALLFIALVAESIFILFRRKHKKKRFFDVNLLKKKKKWYQIR